MKIKGVLLAAILTAALCICGNVFAALSGSGTEANPYLIQSRSDFDEFANPANAATYWAAGVHTQLTTEIDLSGRTYTTAVIAPDTDSVTDGFQGTRFTGIFDGNGHTISNLTIDLLVYDYIGLFGYVGTGGQVKNLGIINANIRGRYGHYYAGGLAGVNSGTIISCYATGAVRGTSYVGGLAGKNSYGTITSCYATGTVSGYYYVGGLVGENGYGTIISCYATGAVSGTSYVGGLAGKNSSGSLSACYATGSVSGTDNYVGGLAGYHHSGTITSCYATGAVSGTSYVGGLAGYNYSGTITFCFWDIQTSGQATSAGGTGKTTAQMQTLSTFTSAGWDFVGESTNGLNDYWQMDGAEYPHLAASVWTLMGEGTSANPYIVSAPSDMGKVWQRPSASYRLDCNLNLTGISWSTAVVPEFSGCFEGNWHTISNLTINQPAQDYIGLFGYVGTGGQVKNLGVINATIQGCDSVGGLAGKNSSSTITDCYAMGSVCGFYHVGGLVGENVIGTTTSCYATGAVSGTSSVGGLVGYHHSGTITSCYATGAVSGTGTSSKYVGGLAGYNYGSIASSFWDKETSGQTTSAGGIGKTTAEMMTLSTFTGAGWDFSATDGDAADWIMLRPEEDYPRLAWQPVIASDIAGLYGVNSVDYAEIAAHWGQTGCPTGCENADINNDGTVDINDLIALADNWLEGF